MVATAAKTYLKRLSVVSPLAYEVVMGLTGFTPPGESRGMSEVTPITGGASIRKDGKKTFGPISGEAPWDPLDASHIALLAAIQDDTPAADTWQIGTTLTTNPGLGFSGFVSDVSLTCPNSDFWMLKVTIIRTSEVTEGANISATPSATYDPIVGNGTVVNFGGNPIAGAENFEITGLTREAVSGAAMDDDAPTVFPSYARKRGNFSYTMMYDDADVTHQAIKTAYDTPNTATPMTVVCSDTGGTTVGFTAVVTGWDYSDLTAINRVKVSGYLTTDVTVTP